MLVNSGLRVIFTSADLTSFLHHQRPHHRQREHGPPWLPKNKSFFMKEARTNLWHRLPFSTHHGHLHKHQDTESPHVICTVQVELGLWKTRS